MKWKGKLEQRKEAETPALMHKNNVALF